MLLADWCAMRVSERVLMPASFGGGTGAEGCRQQHVM